MNLKQIVIGIFIGMLIIAISLIASVQCTDRNTIEDQSQEIESLRKEVETYKFKLDSTKTYYNKRIDSLVQSKNKIRIVYEQVEKDFSDHRIVSDDSILVYIASQIQD
jgi:uncharacterized membrane-anchored protein YhcB (DUF1043 family)